MQGEEGKENFVVGSVESLDDFVKKRAESVSRAGAREGEGNVDVVYMPVLNEHGIYIYIHWTRPLAIACYISQEGYYFALQKHGIDGIRGRRHTSIVGVGRRKKKG